VPTVTVIGGVQADLLMSPVTDLPPSGGSMLTDDMSLRIGGAGANAALAFVETEMTTRLVGCVGDDELGRWMRSQLETVGLARDLVISEDEPTGLTVALESPVRDRTFITYLGVNARWGPSTIPADALACDNLLLCDYFVMPGLQGDAARHLLTTARAAGARTFFDTAWDPGGFTDPARAEVRELLALVDVFLPNEAEARALAGAVDASPANAAHELQAASGGWVVVKLGADGCLAVGPDGVELAVAAPAVHATDTTGAGDAFNAALVNAVSHGSEWSDALQAATLFASTMVARPSNDRHRLPNAGRADGR
jgi:sugar/nucleoside kinase (ribokinase family)